MTDYGTALLTTAEMAHADGLAVAAGIASLTLMENAGRAVADRAATMALPGATIAVLCGPGNNGGDGFVAARHLTERGFDVRVSSLGDCHASKGDAADMAARYGGAVRPLQPASIAGAALVIDAIFGAGLNRPVPPVTAQIIALLAATDIPVLAVDVPSGLDGTTGNSDGPVMKATATVTFFRRKPGHLLLPGRNLCGEVHVADIGIPAMVLDDVRPKTFANELPLWLESFPWPAIDGHKYQRGHGIVVSGPPHQTGAARLAARAALRIGAGLVTVASPAAAMPINAAHLTAIMLQPFSGPRSLAEVLSDKRITSVLIGPGCGIGDETRALVDVCCHASCAVVLDADALTSFAADNNDGNASGAFGFTASKTTARANPADLFALIHRHASPVVMTPHAGEFARLFPGLAGSKLDQARAAAKLSGAIVVLKGADTIIADPNGRAAINANAPPWLATAGSGDVLAGLIAGLLAQRMTAFDAACAAVWLHGEVADQFGPGMIAEDLPETLHQVLGTLLRASRSPGWRPT